MIQFIIVKLLLVAFILGCGYGIDRWWRFDRQYIMMLPITLWYGASSAALVGAIVFTGYIVWLAISYGGA